MGVGERGVPLLLLSPRDTHTHLLTRAQNLNCNLHTHTHLLPTNPPNGVRLSVDVADGLEHEGTQTQGLGHLRGDGGGKGRRGKASALLQWPQPQGLGHLRGGSSNRGTRGVRSRQGVWGRGFHAHIGSGPRACTL